MYDQVLAEMVKFAANMRVGNGADAGTDLGPIQNEPQYRKVLEYIDDCKANGYRFASGGEVKTDAAGWFVPITLIDNPPEDSRIVRRSLSVRSCRPPMER